jgi:hypothetical protein
LNLSLTETKSGIFIEKVHLSLMIVKESRQFVKKNENSFIIFVSFHSCQMTLSQMVIDELGNTGTPPPITKKPPIVGGPSNFDKVKGAAKFNEFKHLLSEPLE